MNPDYWNSKNRGWNGCYWFCFPAGQRFQFFKYNTINSMNITIQNSSMLPDIRKEEINSNNPINSTNEVYEVYSMDNNASAIPVEIVEESIPQYTNNVTESNKNKAEVDTNGIGCITVLPSQDQHTINNQGMKKPIAI